MFLINLNVAPQMQGSRFRRFSFSALSDKVLLER